VVGDDAGRGRNAVLAVGKNVELLDNLVRIAAGRQVDENLDLVGRVVVDVLDLELPLGVGRDDRLDQRDGGRAVGQLGDGEQVFAALLDLGADLHFAAAFAVVVFREVGDAAGREIGINAEGFALQAIDRRAAKVVEIVRQDL